MLWVLACGEAPQPAARSAAPSPEQQHGPVREAVAQHTGMPSTAAQALSITMMPNDTLAVTRDAATRLCFVAAISGDQWSVVFAGTQSPPGLLHALPAQSMGQQVDAEAAVRWMEAHCGQP